MDNADFSTAADWTAEPSLGALAVEDEGEYYWVIGNESAIYQDVSLAPSTDYAATIIVHSLTPSDATIPLRVLLLGGSSVDLSITAPGEYTANLTTPAEAGPYEYRIENLSSTAGLNIDYTCIVENGGNGGDFERTCIAPTNGDFATANGWIFDRGAAWQPAQIADLPANSAGLVYSDAAEPLPTVAAGNYLILAFDAAADGSGGRIGSYVEDGFYNASGYFDVFPAYHTYEQDISHLAGGAGAKLYFANAVTGTITADLQLDNVCIFESPDPPQTPYPTGGGLITPIDLGYSFSSCADVDAIWAGFGVNMAQYRANYAAGFSFWDPIEWLASAIWVTLADWSCMFMAAFSSFMNALEYLINSLLNVFSWVGVNARNIVNWLAGNINYFFGILRQYHLQLGVWLSNASAWIGDSLNNLSPYLGGVLSYWAAIIGAYWTPFHAAIGDSLSNYSAWLGQILSTYSAWLGQWLNNASAWLGASLSNASAWLGETLSNMSAWLGQWLNNASAWLGASLSNASAWLGETLSNMSAWLGQWLNNASAWLGASLSNASAWLGETLSNMWDALMVVFGAWFEWLGSVLGISSDVYNWIVDKINLLMGIIGAAVSGLLDWLAVIWNETIFPLLQASYDNLQGIFGQVGPVIADLVLAAIDLAIAVIKWLITNVVSIASIPRTIYQSFQAGIDSPAYTAGLFECSAGGLWCFIFAGIDLMNQALGPVVLYPLIIVFITIATVLIFKREIGEFGEFILDTVRDL